MKFELWVATDKVGSKCSREIEVDEEDWNNMDEFEQCDYMQKRLYESSMIEWGYNEKDK